MKHQTKGSIAAMLVLAMLLPFSRADGTEPPGADDRIVPPSEYVDEIETPGKTGGVEDEADSADAQAEAAERGAAPAPSAEPKQNAAAIAMDLFLGRPTGLMAMVAGSAFFVLSLPITAPSGMYDEALERFVEEPVNRLTVPLGG